MPQGPVRRSCGPHPPAYRCARRTARNAEIGRQHDLGPTHVNRRTGKRIMYIQRRHWLDYDPVALAALLIGIGIIELLALIIWRRCTEAKVRASTRGQSFAPDLGDI